jgi:thiamine transport system permease protein
MIPKLRNIKISNLILWIVPILFLILFYFYPLGSILNLSFSYSERGWIEPIKEVFTSPTIRNIVGFTFWQAALSTILTMIIGLPGAYLLARYDFRGKSFLQALTGIPFVMPTLVVAAAFNAMLGSRGWVNLGLMELFGFEEPPIHFTNTLYAILVAHVFYNTTIVLRLVGDFWSHLDPRMTQAAQVLGANRWRSLRHINLPLLSPAITAAALLVFIFNFTSFGVILVLGGPQFATMEVEIYYQTVSLFNLPLAAALAIVQLTFTLVLTIVYTRLARKLSRPLSVKPRAYTQRKLSSWQSRLFAGLIIIILLTLLVAPLASLAIRSVTRLEPDRGQHEPIDGGLTLDFYRELSINRRRSLFYVPPTTAIGISLGYAALTVLLALALGIPAAWALSQHSSSRLNQILDPMLMLPIGTSAVTLGLGFIIALDRPPLDLRASPLLIPLAHTLVALPFVVRSMTPALKSIQPRIRHAASVMGASPLKVFRHIDLPLGGRAILVAATFAFTISLGEFGATAMIARPEYPTVPIAIYRYISQPGGLNYGQALALSTILMLVAGGGMLAIERFRIADIGEF